ncbi:hypothetical protein [Brachyspira catarrhinii]|uniref:Lipoprotein n=1 Tax=Brachyspira catarrhinii TaxID=2528966 RepID=A0ABY2TTD2_9SPIR|nr:hypothetical protein [Brachyspira catarrhinii]TKZ36016.1 hypothetical protein EZH24_02230 [Brachyspira catarrhinii]
MFRNILILFFIVFLSSCKTITEIQEKEETTPAIEEKKEEEKPKITIKEYGADGEVLSVKIDDKTYYVLGKNNPQNINEQNIKNLSLVAPLKIAEETVRGNKGIVITYYDVKIFLGEKGAGVKVGLFEPQKNAWTVGDDIDRSQSIQIKLADNGIGLITVGRSSISLSYR